MEDCIFCKIVNKEIPATIVYEDKDFLVFEDTNPKAAVHLLVVPKIHMASVRDEKDINPEHMGKLILTGKQVAALISLEDYRMQLNNGKYAEVRHMHLHIMS
jgi:histidine triad (HIT) family protein